MGILANHETLACAIFRQNHVAQSLLAQALQYFYPPSRLASTGLRSRDSEGSQDQSTGPCHHYIAISAQNTYQPTNRATKQTKPKTKKQFQPPKVVARQAVALEKVPARHLQCPKTTRAPSLKSQSFKYSK